MASLLKRLFKPHPGLGFSATFPEIDGMP